MSVIDQYKDYFFNEVIKRSEGSSANDWVEVLTNSGLPAGPAAGVVPPSTPHHGLTQQKGVAGNVKGRLFIPTDKPDENGFYTFVIDIVSNESDGSHKWVWVVRGGPEPRPFESPSPNPSPTPDTGLEARLEAVEQSLEDQIQVNTELNNRINDLVDEVRELIAFNQKVLRVKGKTRGSWGHSHDVDLIVTRD